MTSTEYSHEYNHAEETIRLGVHCNGPTREPRIRWQISNQSGEHGYIRLDGTNSVVRLEGGETAHLDGRQTSSIPAPQEVAEELNTAVKKLGTVVADSNRISADPTAFPSIIEEFERIGWEPERDVMWYWRDQQSSPRAYQIERGELIFRAQEWADKPCSKKELIQNYDLNEIRW